jgi:hypothetical protein
LSTRFDEAGRFTASGNICDEARKTADVGNLKIRLSGIGARSLRNNGAIESELGRFLEPGGALRYRADRTRKRYFPKKDGIGRKRGVR